MEGSLFWKMGETGSESKWRKRLVNKKTYTILFGLSGCAYSASFRYFNGTITTIEKRFKIPSRNTGIISIGNDVSQIFASVFLVYYGAKGNRPKWMSTALFGIALYCLISALPHLLYGPGKEALGLTREHGLSWNASDFVLEKAARKDLCNQNATLAPSCDVMEGDLLPQIILFAAQCVFGIAEAVYYVFGLTYLDDNADSARSPLMISFSYFLKMIGPAVGYNLAAYCLTYFIAPTLTPTITNKDPRWIGCWWAGWFVLTGVLSVFAILMRAFPKNLPSKETKPVELIPLKTVGRENECQNVDDDEEDGIWRALQRTFSNKILMFNNFATVFYFFGSMSYAMFGPKYMEMQYLISPGQANFYSGTIKFIASAFGILSAGLWITRFKPVARTLAAWNVFVPAISIVALLIKFNLGCTANDNAIIFKQDDSCNCDYVKYSPVCGSDNFTYVSACHAGCSTKDVDGTYLNCPGLSFARSGACPVNCERELTWFLVVSCISFFLGASGVISNFIVALRCVEKRDKSLSIGVMFGLVGVLAFIPAPIMYGALIDKTCLFWGKTCGSKGNCWLYDGEKMRFVTNIIGAGFTAIGTLCDVGVWYYCKDLKVFDDEETEKKEIQDDAIVQEKD